MLETPSPKTEHEWSALALPPLTDDGGVPTPAAPETLEGTGAEHGLLADIALKATHTVPRCSAKWVAEQMRLPLPIIEDLLMGMANDHLLDVLGLESPSNHRFAVARPGHERTLRLLDVSRYIGPAPVSLDTYTAMILEQQKTFPEVQTDEVEYALRAMVLPPENVLVATMAVTSQRSLFLWGPAGNGKTSLAQALHRAFQGELWIPYCLAIGSDIIQVFDPSVHQPCNNAASKPWNVDQRWVRIKRPLIVAGGEMTIDSLELTYTEKQGFYELPLHIKANGGTFVIDDFGRQRVDPWALLNRWIVPMEHGYDYFGLKTGRKITLPFAQMLIVATNLDPKDVMDPAFLRRMGYRIHLGTPDEERYRDIFAAFAHKQGLEVPVGLIQHLLGRYRAENRPLRACEPRDLIGRVQDICQMRHEEFRLSGDLIDLAWCAYFGSSSQEDDTI